MFAPRCTWPPNAPYMTVCSCTCHCAALPFAVYCATLHTQHSASASPTLLVTSTASHRQLSVFCMTVSCVMQPHPASAAAAAVLVAHASSLGPDGNANTKYNADGSSFTGGLNEMEQGMGQGPLGQRRDVVNVAALVRQQTHGPVSYHIICFCMCSWCRCMAALVYMYV